MHQFVDALLYLIGWLIFLFGQMEGSLRSNSNGLKNDWPSRWKWISVQSDKLLTRAFFSAILEPIIVKLLIQKIEAPLQAVGLSIAAWSASGLAGYCACSLVYQITGLIPGLRAEIPELAPTPELAAKQAEGIAPEPK